MILPELQELVKEQILVTIPALEALLTKEEMIFLVDVAIAVPLEAALQDLDSRLARGGSYVEKVAELRSDFGIEE